jgi:hypothetical protein
LEFVPKNFTGFGMFGICSSVVQTCIGIKKTKIRWILEFVPRIDTGFVPNNQARFGRQNRLLNLPYCKNQMGF